ncbi:uncharacterized protein [Drosophila virilis]|uniref:Uncharacterized protein n=1 Tax=Drosophila virilis TaxID=7244 RepID=B4LKZ0_DROVI|nr:uncharacterized protein LOC6626025 [Drosophila virilis]EDW60794.2 uncharacterized protein Dvir_GJ21686 [Drosophila virilis]
MLLYKFALLFQIHSFVLLALTMLHSHQFIFLLWLLAALLSDVNGLPFSFNWGPSANRGPSGGPAWNGGSDQSTDNIILHSNGKWRY